MVFNLSEFKKLVDIDIKSFNEGTLTNQEFKDDLGKITRKYDEAIEAIDIYDSYNCDAHTTWHDGEFDLDNEYTAELFSEFSNDEQVEIKAFIEEMKDKNCAYCEMDEVSSVEEFRNAHHTDGIAYKIIDVKKVLKEAYDVIPYIKLMCDCEDVDFDDIYKY